MRIRSIVILILFPFFISGCLFSTPKKSSKVFYSASSATGTLIREEEFKKGGTLVILPFKAGVNAGANRELDRMSLMIVKGMIDYLSEQRTPFTILSSEDEGRPQLLVDGYVDDFARPGKMGRWVLRNKESLLKVSGQMTVAGTKERVLLFEHTKSMVDAKDGLGLAYQVGQDLGRFIVDALE